MNVLNMLDTPFTEVMENIFNKNLNTENCKFKKKASCLVYMVSPNYALSGPKANLEYTLKSSKFNTIMAAFWGISDMTVFLQYAATVFTGIFCFF